MAPRTSVSSMFLSSRKKLGSTELPNLEPRLHIGDCDVAHNLHWELVVCRDQVTKSVCSKYGITCAFSIKGSCNFGSPAYYAISVLRDASTISVVFQIPIPFLLARLFLILEKNLLVRTSVPEHSSSTRFFSEIFQPFRNDVQRVSTCSLCALIFTSAFGFSRPPQVYVCLSTWTLT